MNSKTVITIFKKELASFFNTVSSYAVIIVFLLLWEFLFLRSAFIVGESSLRSLFELFPWLAIIVVPAITMGSISREKDDGTLEIILTKPVRELELLHGKWLSAVTIVCCTLLFTVPIAIMFSLHGTFDWGAYAGQFIGALFLGSALAAIGIFVSTFLSTQIASLLVSSAVSFAFLIIGSELITASLPLAFVPVLERLSLSTHFSSIARGVFDTRDVWFFLSFSAIFFALSYLELLKRKYGNLKRKCISIQTTIVLFTVIVILTNLIGDRIPGRLDITQSRSFTLSEGTKKTMRELPDIVTITFYATSKLPPQYAPILRETKDILKDFKIAAGEKLTVLQKDPSTSEEAKSEAGSQGIQEMQFNVIGDEELQVKTGYLGLTIEYAGNSEAIPFVQDITDLEYQLTSLIHKLTIKDKKTITVLSGHGEKDITTDYEMIATELSKQFTLTPGPEIATGSAAVWIAGPTETLEDTTIESIQAYIQNGGSTLWFIDSIEISAQTGVVMPNSSNAASVLKEFGITVDSNTVYDVRSHELVTLGGRTGSYVTPYPFWVRAEKADSPSPIITRIDGILLPWSSSLSVNENVVKEKGYTVKNLITTSQYAGTKTGSFSVQPGQVEFGTQDLKRSILAVSLEPEKERSGGRMVIVGDSDFAVNDFVQNSPNNGNFIFASLGWLAQEDYIAAIGARKPIAGRMLFRSQNDIMFIKYGLMALALLVPAAYGFLRISKRQNLKRLTYRTPS